MWTAGALAGEFTESVPVNGIVPILLILKPLALVGAQAPSHFSYALLGVTASAPGDRRPAPLLLRLRGHDTGKTQGRGIFTAAQVSAGDVRLRAAMRREEGRRNVPPALKSLLVQAEHSLIVAGLGGAVERRRRLQLDVERACGRVKRPLDLALATVAPHLCLKLQARLHRGPVRAVAAMLCGGAIARQIKLAHHDHMPAPRLTPRWHAVDRRAVTLARAMIHDRESVALRNLKSPLVLVLLLPAVHGLAYLPYR